ncbi:anti-sigma factor [Microbacterium allomyrinae]|uniref:Regulator of SigK n=1 Tax=Microbacterium allomyrinae TaxID=2830666 RepID=A0A9X1LS44_9MICO|nr:anti-sigma factor [Microbacterium allomyrinae]MCC2030994.1 anti-sigma factor [Microbacterium allomyrinae]
MNEQEFAELAAGYALNALSPEDLRTFETERAHHPEWEHWIISDAATAAELAPGAGEAAPPLTTRSALLSRIATMPQLPDAEASVAAAAIDAGDEIAETATPDPMIDPSPTTTTIQAVSRRNWTRGLLALAASFVVLVVLGFGAASINEIANRPAAVVALNDIEAAPDAQSATVAVTGGGTATAHWAPSIGKAVVVTNGIAEIPEDEVFELWWVGDEGAVSAGTFEAGSDGSTTVLMDGEWAQDAAIAVTVEPDGGAPDGIPTTEPIVVIPTA